MKRRIQLKLAAAQSGRVLPDFLADRFTYHTREQWLARIAEQRVKVDGEPASADTVTAAGTLLEYIADEMPEPPVCFDVTIVYEDYDIMVVNKPANLPCHPAGRYFNHTLWAWLKTHRCIESPTLVNRLDRETSGLSVVAKNSKAEARCRAQFAKRRVVKRYLAVVEGVFPEAIEARGWMLPNPESGVHKRRRFAPAGTGALPDAPPSADAEWAETDFRRLHSGNGLSLVEAVLHTGRLHQIRASVNALGYPLVGDKLYGPDPMIFVRFCTDTMTEEDWCRLRLPRQALHAAELEFQHPVTGVVLHFEAPLPADLAGLLR